MKLRVMIVDDEPISAQSTAIMIKQTKADLDVAGLCFSGREAIKNATVWYPDLVIMDIQMPGINGLEALAQIKSQLPYVQFIILSAYSEFCFAVEALNLGACDYLLKPVKQELFNVSIQKAINGIKTKKQEMEKVLIQMERLEIAQPMIVRDFIQALLPEAYTDEKLIACANFLGLSEKSCFIITLSGRDERSFQSLEAVLNTLSIHTTTVFHVISHELAIACVEIPADAVKTAFTQQIIAHLDSLLSQYTSNGKPLKAGCGNIVDNVLDIKLSLLQAMSAMAYKIPEKKGSACLIFEEGVTPFYTVGNFPLDNRSKKTTVSSTKHIIDRAIQFIKNNHQRDLSLDNVAAEVNLSPYYFSRLFKEYTGVNFTETLLQVRVDKAKELLLQQNSTVKDVAYEVGYNDPNYFSKVFHKTTGVKASDYRSISDNAKDD